MTELADNEAAKANPLLQVFNVLVGAWTTTGTHPHAPGKKTRLVGMEWRWWRNATDISQRFVGTISADARTIVSRGEYSRNGGPWEPDLALTYRRVD